MSDPWAHLARLTPARIALGRTGDALPTARVLEFAAAHALARDAVHVPLDVAALAAELGPGTSVVRSGAIDRAAFLKRPDLGRRLAAATALPQGEFDAAFVFADGLSAVAVQRHAPALWRATCARLAGWRLAPPVVALQARVGLSDPIGAALGARLVVMLIGERPGLSAADSLGAYLTWAPRPGRQNAERNCISNIRPEGLPIAAAAARLAALMTLARSLKLTGVGLKEDQALPAAVRPAIEG